MKYRLVIIMLVVLCSLDIVQAQEAEPQYRLHVPSADEYLSDIQTLLTAPIDATTSITSKRQLVEAVTTEWVVRFAHSSPSLVNLVNAFNALAKAYEFWYGRDIFGKQIVQTMIDENILAFDNNEITKVHYDAFDVEVTPRDFNGDGQPEWTLYVQSSAFTQRYVVAYQDQQYQLIDVPLPWFGCCFGYYSTPSGFTEEQLFADLTGDGLPEWVIAFGGIGANDTNYGELYVFQWQDDKVVDVSAIVNNDNQMSYISPAGGGMPLFPYGVSITFSNPNKDLTRNIIIRHIEHDNWGCSWEDQKTFAWQGKGFELIKNQRIYNDVQGCEIRRAEEAVWSFDYKTAIEHYERGLKLPITQEYFTDNPQELTRYATARLAIAYKLVGRDQDATNTINSLTPNEIDSPTLVNFIAAIKTNLDDSMRLCNAAFEVFNFECPVETDACLGSPLKVRVGDTIENSGEGVSSPRHSYPEPERAGCDVAGPLKVQLTSNPLSTTQSPQTQLEKLGYKVLHTVHFDLNGDGLDEWLVWLDLAAQTLLFSAEMGDSSYHFTYVPMPLLTTNPDYPTYTIDPSLNPFMDNTAAYIIKTLPDHSRKILITFQSNSAKAHNYTCPPVRTSDNGIYQRDTNFIFVFWQLEGHQLKFQQEFSFCENATLKDTFGDGEDMPLEFDGWAYPQGKTNYVVHASYAWDESQHRYVVNATKPIADLTIDYSQDYENAMWATDASLQKQDFAKALDIIELGLTDKNIDKDTQLRMLFSGALAFQMLNRPDEALKEYVTIYKNVPDSAWGKLAALHLECVANCAS